MQPYFFPYIGYWQLLNAVDLFIVYDKIKFTKKGWIHRNRFLLNGKDHLFSLSLKKDSDYLNICDRRLSEVNQVNIRKIKNRIADGYKNAPCYYQVMPLLNEILDYNSSNLFDYLYNSLVLVKNYLGIGTPIKISSSIDFDNELKSQDKVIAICRQCGGTTYINTIGGTHLYDHKIFASNGIDLKFIRIYDISYQQFSNEFIPNLSIIDVMMFNSIEQIRRMLNQYLASSMRSISGTEIVWSIMLPM